MAENATFQAAEEEIQEKLEKHIFALHLSKWWFFDVNHKDTGTHYLFAEK